MNSRLLQALLYFLPGNLYQSPDNPLQADRLPDISRVELDYPVYQDPPESAARSFGIILFLSSLVAPCLAWTAHLVPIPFLYGGLNTVALLIAGGLIVLGILGRWWPLASFGAAAVVIPALAMLSRDVPFAFTALSMGFAALCFFADSLVTSYLHFKTAAPLPRKKSRKVRRIWRRRFFNFFSPIRGSEFYVVGFLVLVPAACLGVLAIASRQGNEDSSNALLLFLLLTALGVSWFLIHERIVGPLFGRSCYSLRASFTAMIRALVIWSTYNRRQTRGAGVHQMTSGPCNIRRYLLIGLVASWGCVWAGLQPHNSSHPLANYFEGFRNPALLLDRIVPRPNPIREEPSSAVPLRSGPEKSGDRPLFSTALDTNEFIDQVWDPLTGKPPEARRSRAPTVDSKPAQPLPPDLEPYEVEFLNRLPQDQKADYLSERLALRIAQVEKDEATTRQASAAESPKTFLARFFQKMVIVLANVIFPSLLVITACGSLLLAMTGRALAGIEECFGDKPPERVFTTENWENLVARLRRSRDKTEKDSVLAGVNSRDDTPVLVPRDVFFEHAHVLGDSGSGKTSIGLVPLISQLIRFGDCSIVVMDLKADDQFILETLRLESASLRGYPFRWFTTVLGRSSYAFNPMTQRVMSQLDPDQRTDIITAAMGLQYGTDYGRKYYGDANYDLLNYALRENPNIQSLSELEQILARAESFALPHETKKAATHVRSSVRRLARCEALNAGPNKHTPNPIIDQAIDLDQLFSQPQALYIALPPSAGISSTAEIARIFLYSLLAAAQAHNGPRKRVVLVIDEFQRLLSKNVELFLQQARSMNIGCILSNQSLSDLDTIDANLLPAVRTNTRFRQVFGAGHRDDIRDLIDSAGETVFANRNWNFTPGLFTPQIRGVGVTETRGTRLTINDVLLATDAPGRNIACVRRGDGYAQFGGMPFLMDSVYHIDEFEYGRRCTATWPEPNDSTIVATMPKTPTSGALSAGSILGSSAPTGGDNETAAAPTSVSDESSLTPDAADASPGPGEAEGILDDPITALYHQQLAEREARLKRRSKLRQ